MRLAGKLRRVWLVVVPVCWGLPAAAQCPGGTLIRAGSDSLTVEMNRKTSVIRVAPGAEIWRRGADLDNAAKLVAGDQIYAHCRGDVADVIVAAEEGDAVDMTPHHVQEIRACGGKLASFDREMVTAREDGGKVYRMRVTPETVIWRGEIYHETSPLHRGDDITARCVVHYPDEALTADAIFANITNTEGRIAKVVGDRMIVVDAYERGSVTVVIDDRTTFDGGRRADLKPGRGIRAVGLELGRRKFRATAIAYEK